jgi:DNA repair protein RecO (recombination protein O)
VPRHGDEAFVLRTGPLGEADLLVVFLARKAGKVRAVAKSARRSRKRFGGALEPLSRVTAQWSETRGGGLQRLESAELLASSLDLPSDLATFYRMGHVAELAETFAREGEGDETAFRLLRAVVDAVAAGTDAGAAVRYFEIWTLRLAGVLAEPGRCVGCGTRLGEGPVRADAASGGARCASCASAPGVAPRRIPAEDWAFLRTALESPVTAMPAGRAGSNDVALERFLHRALTQYTERPLRAHRALERLSGRRRSRAAPGDDRR